MITRAGHISHKDYGGENLKESGHMEDVGIRGTTLTQNSLKLGKQRLASVGSG